MRGKIYFTKYTLCIVNQLYNIRFMYAGAKKCIRQTLGWTAYVDDGWKDVDVTFTCAGGNPSEEYRINIDNIDDRG